MEVVKIWPGPTGKGMGHQAPQISEAKEPEAQVVPAASMEALKVSPEGAPMEDPNDAPMKEGLSDAVPETQKDGETPDEKATEDVHTWPESWSGATAWESWGDFGWKDWSWGGGWYDSAWNQQAHSQEHLQWRERSKSLGSGSYGGYPYGRQWSQASLETPDYKRSGSLDSELAAAFQRLDTVDRLGDKDLPQVAKSLGESFEDAVTPDKKANPTPTTTSPQTSLPSSQQSSPSPSQTETPSKAPDACKKIPETETKPEKKTEAKGAEAKQEGSKSEKTDDKQAEGSKESKAEKKAAEQVEKKKAAHARYMRYWRSVHGGVPRF